MRGAAATIRLRSGIGRDPLRRVTPDSEEVHIPKGIRTRRLHKAFLRYHDLNNWPLLREALREMGRADLIGNGRQQLVPTYQPIGTGRAHEGKRKPKGVVPAAAASTAARPFRTQHTGLPHTPPRPPKAHGKTKRRRS